MELDSDPAALGPHELLLFLQNDVEAWAAPLKGKVTLAGDPGNVLEQLMDAPQGFRVVLAWGGDADQTGEPEAGIVDNTLEVWLMKARGLRKDAGASLVTPAPGTAEPPFLALLSELRRRCRSLAWPELVTYGRLHYKGAVPFPSLELAYELPTTGWKLSFTITASVPWEELRG